MKAYVYSGEVSTPDYKYKEENVPPIEEDSKISNNRISSGKE